MGADARWLIRRPGPAVHERPVASGGLRRQGADPRWRWIRERFPRRSGPDRAGVGHSSAVARIRRGRESPFLEASVWVAPAEPTDAVAGSVGSAGATQTLAS